MDYEIFNSDSLNINLIGTAENSLKYLDLSFNNSLKSANKIIEFPYTAYHPFPLMFPMSKYT